MRKNRNIVVQVYYKTIFFTKFKLPSFVSRLIGKKRKRKDDKFGYGGRKRKMKKNSADSAAEMSSFKSDIHGKARNKPMVSFVTFHHLSIKNNYLFWSDHHCEKIPTSVQVQCDQTKNNH